MSHNITFLIIVALKVLASITAIAGATYLAYNDKSGWGWLIFLAILISPGSITLDKDNQDCEQKLKESKIESN